MHSKLPLHEWIIITLLMAIMAMLAILVIMNRSKAEPLTMQPHEVVSSNLYVSIQGAVSKPGNYTLKKGATVRDLVELAELCPEADQTQIKWKNRLREGQIVKIPTRKMITIYLTGAVTHPGPLNVLSGTRLEELSKQITFLPEADVKKLNKKRYLKDQEVVEVLSKKSSKKLS